MGMVSILDMGEERFDRGLEVGVDISRNMFSGGTIRGDDGMAGVTVFMHFRRGVGLGVEGKEISLVRGQQWRLDD